MVLAAGLRRGRGKRKGRAEGKEERGRGSIEGDLPPLTKGDSRSLVGTLRRRMPKWEPACLMVTPAIAIDIIGTTSVVPGYTGIAQIVG